MTGAAVGAALDPMDGDTERGKCLKLQTKYFGLVDYEEEEVLHFPAGIPGFPDDRHFLLLPFADSGNTMFSLQSIETPMLAFVALDPFSLDPGYEPILQPEELSQLGVKEAQELCFYVLCAVHSPTSDSTVNLRCPVAINPHTLEARQILLESDRYEMRHPISSFNHDGGKSC